jgi:hypothetical protein
MESLQRFQVEPLSFQVNLYDSRVILYAFWVSIYDSSVILNDFMLS